MRTKVPTRRLRDATLFAVAFLTTAVGASAQPTAEDDTSEIIVEAPRPVPVPAERSPYSGAPVAVTSVKIPVFYSDLDLTRGEDRSDLRTRVKNVARDACRYLDRLYPLSSDPDCAEKAIVHASAATKAVIAAAAR